MSRIKVSERAPRELEQASGAPAINPELHTHWARDDVNRIRQLERDGYRPAKVEDVGERHAGRYDTVENVIRDGDLVLMVAKRDAAQEKKKKLNVSSAQTSKRAQEALRQQVEADGQVQLTSDPAHNFEVVQGRRRTV